MVLPEVLIVLVVILPSPIMMTEPLAPNESFTGGLYSPVVMFPTVISPLFVAPL